MSFGQRLRWAAIGLPLAALFAAGCSPAPPPDPAKEIHTGGVLYATNGCAACHGNEGHGDGPLAKTLYPPPRDFRDPAAFKNGLDPDSISTTIATGLRRDGGQMQPYSHLSERERHLIALYVISLRQPADARKGNDGQP